MVYTITHVITLQEQLLTTYPTSFYCLEL